MTFKIDKKNNKRVLFSYEKTIVSCGESRNSFIQSIVPLCLTCARASTVDFTGSILILISNEVKN